MLFYCQFNCTVVHFKEYDMQVIDWYDTLKYNKIIYEMWLSLKSIDQPAVSWFTGQLNVAEQTDRHKYPKKADKIFI
jgi:hypothetical protein